MKIQTLLLASVAALAVGGVAQAQDFTPKAAGTKVIDFRITNIAPSGKDPVTTLAGAATGLDAKVGDDTTATLGLSYFFTDNVAVEVIAGTTKHEVRAQGGATNVAVLDSWVLPPTVSVQYHFAPKAKVSPYVGAGVNYMLFYNGKNRNSFDFKVKSGFGTSLQAGVDVAVSGPWSVNLDVKKIFFGTDATDRVNGLKSKVHLDPLVTSAGVAYRF